MGRGQGCAGRAAIVPTLSEVGVPAGSPVLGAFLPSCSFPSRSPLTGARFIDRWRGHRQAPVPLKREVGGLR